MKRARTAADVCPACLTRTLPSREHWLCDRCWRLVPGEIQYGLGEVSRWLVFALGTEAEEPARAAVCGWFIMARDLAREALAAPASSEVSAR